MSAQPEPSQLAGIPHVAIYGPIKADAAGAICRAFERHYPGGIALGTQTPEALRIGAMMVLVPGGTVCR